MDNDHLYTIGDKLKRKLSKGLRNGVAARQYTRDEAVAVDQWRKAGGKQMPPSPHPGLDKGLRDAIALQRISEVEATRIAFNRAKKGGYLPKAEEQQPPQQHQQPTPKRLPAPDETKAWRDRWLEKLGVDVGGV